MPQTFQPAPHAPELAHAGVPCGGSGSGRGFGHVADGLPYHTPPCHAPLATPPPLTRPDRSLPPRLTRLHDTHASPPDTPRPPSSLQPRQTLPTPPPKHVMTHSFPAIGDRDGDWAGSAARGSAGGATSRVPQCFRPRAPSHVSRSRSHLLFARAVIVDAVGEVHQGLVADRGVRPALHAGGGWGGGAGGRRGGGAAREP